MARRNETTSSASNDAATFDIDQGNSILSNTHSSSTEVNTSYEVRPDVVVTSDLEVIEKEDGRIVFDDTDNRNKYWDGSEWIEISSSEDINEKTNLYSQGYIGLLSAYYFGGSATSREIVIEEVDVWQEVVMTIHPEGISDQRVEDMKVAQAQGYEGDGSLGSPIKFLLEGLVEKSFATLRTSMAFIPDEDGGRLDSRLFLERHEGAGDDFSIDAAGLAMESGADELYPHYVNIEFFVGDTIDTNAPGDAGKVRFQVKSDVTGTIFMNEMALFIQK